VATIDLNCDLGEGVGDDLALFRLISSANIACGFHAGDHDSMREACERAVQNGVTIGAHPSYRDREGFGRRDVEISAEQLFDEVVEQVQALRRAADDVGGRVCYLKPHGALYNRIVTDEAQAVAVARAAHAVGLPVLGLAGSAVQRAARELSVRFVSEAFADRGYRADGSLAPRGTPGALLTSPEQIGARVASMILTRSVETVDGNVIELHIDSVCVHGDTPSAAAITAAVRRSLLESGVEIRAFA
jgi:UPF0271 protein